MKHRPPVVDTSVLVSGIVTRNPSSPPVRLVDAMLAGTVDFVISEALLAEYRNVLTRSTIRKRHGLDETEVERVLLRIAENAVVRDPPTIPGRAPDPGDDHLWALLEMHSDLILVTGDEALLRSPPGTGSVVRPRTAVSWWELESEQ